MTDSLTFCCWRCGELLKDIPMPLSRTETCPHCLADIHVCKQCNFYDTSKASHCSEPIADHVNEKTRANFCGYLIINTDIVLNEQANSQSTDNLNALFGLQGEESAISPNQGDEAQAALNDLFGLTDKEKK